MLYRNVDRWRKNQWGPQRYKPEGLTQRSLCNHSTQHTRNWMQKEDIENQRRRKRDTLSDIRGRDIILEMWKMVERVDRR